jgi:isocitrate lyase
MSLSGNNGPSRLQQEEFAAQELGYRGVTHQRFVGTGYFDEIAQVVSGGRSSTTALAGSTEAVQFHVQQEAGLTATRSQLS